MSIMIVLKGDFVPDEVRRISALLQDIESMRPDEPFEMHVDASEMQGEAEALVQAMRPPLLPGYKRTERRWKRGEE